MTLSRAGIAVLVAASTSACGPAIASRVDDGVITTRVRTALLYDSGLAPARLVVVTVDGVVTLSGAAGSHDEAARAAEIARGVEGVRDVVSKVTVVPRRPAPTPGPPASGP